MPGFRLCGQAEFLSQRRLGEHLVQDVSQSLRFILETMRALDALDRVELLQRYFIGGGVDAFAALALARESVRFANSCFVALFSCFDIRGLLARAASAEGEGRLVFHASPIKGGGMIGNFTGNGGSGLPKSPENRAILSFSGSRLSKHGGAMIFHYFGFSR